MESSIEDKSTLSHKHIEILEKGTLRVLRSIDMGRLHLSVSHKHRYPTWDEIKRCREKYLPDEIFFAMILPPKKHYVNCHPYCFHLWQVEDPLKEEIWNG